MERDIAVGARSQSASGADLFAQPRYQLLRPDPDAWRSVTASGYGADVFAVRNGGSDPMVSAALAAHHGPRSNFGVPPCG